MSKINQLIQNLCPAGVEYKKLEDVLTIKNGRDYKQFGDGDVPVYGSGGIMTYINTAVYDKPSVLIPRKGSLDKLYYVDTPFWNVDTIFYTDIDTSLVEPKYIYYYLEGQHLERLNKAGGVPSLTQAVLNKVQLPIPPLEVQCEIVHILDNFTELTDELTAELTARKKQYEFYRNKLLTFDNNVKIVPLADIADIGTGSSNTNEGLEEGKYPFYVRSQEPLRKNEYEYDETAIITAGDGVGVGKVFHYIEGKYALHQRAYRIHINTPDVLPRYYFHYMRAAFLPYIQKTMFQGSVASVRRPMLNKFPVPVPPLDTQKRLVNVLDNFESICTDLNIGLPAEIEARQKQYEYYRDLLLTFAAEGATILTDRQTDRQAIIRLLQYVFGYARIELGIVGKVSMCKRIMKSETNSKGDVPFYKIGTFGKKPDAYITKLKFEEYRHAYSYPNKGDILISAAGTIGRTVVYDGEDAYYQDSNIVWIANDENIVLNRYLFYCYQLQPWAVSTGGTVARLYNDNISRAKINVPSLKEQERIISILDRFDTLCNDLSAGLPAEIEARKKQYEYYRDKLLSFKELPK